MTARKHEAPMSNDARITILESAIININAVLVDIKQDIKYQGEKIEKRLDSFEKSIDKRFEAVDKQFEAVDKRFESIDKRFESIDKRFESIEKKLEFIDNKFDRKFDNIQHRLWSNFIWTISMIIGLAGLIAHAQHWI